MTLEQLETGGSSKRTKSGTINSNLTNTVQSLKDLESRVLLWTKKPDLSQELNDALLVTKNNPESISGYLCAGQLYMIQGNYSNAHHIFEQGISMVMSDSPLYTLLNELNDESKTRIQEHHVDIIAQSPYDILAELANYLRRKDLIVCFQVCRLWRSKWLEIPDSWRKIHATETSNADPILRVLPLVSHHVEDIYINMNPADISKILEVLRSCNLSNLTSLSISSSGNKRTWYKDDDHIDPDTYALINSVYDTLHCIGKTLTHLHHNIRETGQAGISLDRVLPSCPNLQTFRCKSEYIVDRYFGGWLTYDTQLTHLELETGTIRTSVVETILRRSPQLETLTLQGCNYQEILPILQESCSKLDLLRLNSFCTDRFYKLDQPSNGLHLFLGKSSSVKLLLPYLDTLGCLVIEDIKGTPEDWSELSTFTSPNLKTLHLSFDQKSPIQTYLADILRRHPCLENLRLQCSVVGAVPDIPFNAIDYMRNLTSLSLWLDDIQGPVFLQLLQMYAAQDQDAPLSRLEIITYQLPHLIIISTIASIRSLTCLTLEFYNQFPEIDGDNDSLDTTEFARRIGELPKLQEMVIEGLEINEEAARHIIQCKSLKILRVPYLDDLDDEAYSILTSHIATVRDI